MSKLMSSSESLIGSPGWIFTMIGVSVTTATTYATMRSRSWRVGTTNQVFGPSENVVAGTPKVNGSSIWDRALIRCVS